MANEELLNEDEVSILELTDEDGNEVAFEIVDSVDYEGDEYLILLPLEEEDPEVVILKVVPDGKGNESFVTVDTEETLMAVFEIFKERFKDIFTFEG